MPVIPTLGRFRQEHVRDFKISFNYVEISRPAWGPTLTIKTATKRDVYADF